MILADVVDVARKGGWLVGAYTSSPRAGVRIELHRDDLSIHIHHDKWRHTNARAYRGNALTAILPTQRAVVEWLS